MRNNKNKCNKSRSGAKFKDDKGTQNNAFFHSREVESSKSEPKSSDFNHHGDEKSFNDPEWYVNSEQILKDVARVPYSIPVGTCVARSGFIDVDEKAFQSASYDNAIPGIMVSYLMPTLGATNQNASAGLNIAANSLFQFVRSKISGTRKYESVDMMIYMGCMDSIFTNITWLTRIYATVFTYHQSNKYLAEALVQAQGVDYDSIVNNLPQFRSALNIEIAKIRAMYLPNVLPIFKRHSWMFSHYFIEGDSEKDQIYCHAPAGYYVFDTDDDGKGMMKAFRHPYETTRSWNQLIQDLRDQINAIFRREDFNTISGDLLKAYEGKVFTLTEIPDIATVSLTNSTEVLLQFKNGKYKSIPTANDSSSSWLGDFFSYRQNDNGDLLMAGCTTLYGTPSIQAYMTLNSSNDNVIMLADVANRAIVSRACLNEWTKDTLLTTPTHDVQPVENMINTRLTLGLELSNDPNAVNLVKYEQAFFGSEWPVNYRLFAYHRNKTNGLITLFSRTYDRVLALSLQDKAAEYWVTSHEPIRSAFRYLPEISLIPYVWNAQGLESVSEAGRSIFEVDNYAFVNVSTLEGLHTAAILGEYDIPNLSIGR